MMFVNQIFFNVLGEIGGLNFVIKLDNLNVWGLYTKYFSRYKAKSLDCEIQVTVIYIYFKVKPLVVLTPNWKERCL